MIAMNTTAQGASINAISSLPETNWRMSKRYFCASRLGSWGWVAVRSLSKLRNGLLEALNFVASQHRT